MQENPQENNNFETIISTWRRLSGELAEPTIFASMSGDSGSHPFKKKEEEGNLLILEKPKGPIATAASAGAILTLDEKPPDQETLIKGSSNPEEKQDKPEPFKFDKEDGKEAAGDASFDDKDDKSFLENESADNTFSETKNMKDKGDNVDSVYLRPPPPHKVRSNASTAEDEDCGIKCLYYTLQCCDCVLM